ncbi:cation:proton antiporter [Adhaeribacter radiodurans]|uniref:Cation:proton antiporter n=1 Tax=Adhaeribacter radiodurans TaxID=2745197 RepID=A0A7L7L2T4_9BACT|nr:cation:proton antiporter [Adhaeribacter radiodurans]QMU27106.1 cation:proton antiporter [Adhaeribacter radiodurans]
MDPYILIITIIGLAALTMAWLPNWLEKLPVSYSILFVALGFILYQFSLPLPNPNPLENEILTVRLTEIGVIITLMGTGIKINRSFSWKNWKIPFLLVFVTMLFCISALALLGWWVLGLAPASALLLGAVMAPTDPVLASEVQVGPPSTEKEDHVRFSLTAEAGMNDGMAFPFTWLAIALALAAQTGEDWFWSWLGRDLLYKIVVGTGIGYLMGRFLAHLAFVLPEKLNFPETKDGFVAVSATLLVYGLTEIVHGYGFIAVFVTGLTLSRQERTHKLHRELHDFTDQMERLFLVVVLLLLGGSIATGLLDALTLPGIVIGLLFVFVIRPLFSYLTLVTQKITFREKVAISFFGIRGIGSFYYLSFALTQAVFPAKQELWSIAGFIVLISVLVHGILASPVMQYLDLRRTKSDLVIK